MQLPRVCLQAFMTLHHKLCCSGSAEIVELALMSQSSGIEVAWVFFGDSEQPLCFVQW